MRRTLTWLLAAVVLTAALVAGGVALLGGDEPAPAPRAPFTTTPLAGFDQGSVRVTRGPFCDAIDPRQVSAAVGGTPAASTSWDNGDRVALGTAAEDVVHEFGCQYDGADQSVARAWAFAPPVSTDTATDLATRAGRARGCTPLADPAFGSPGVGLSCELPDGTASASYRGLFGDTWLACEVVRPAGATWDVADRAGRWCVGVLEGLDAAQASAQQLGQPDAAPDQE